MDLFFGFSAALGYMDVINKISNVRQFGTVARRPPELFKGSHVEERIGLGRQNLLRFRSSESKSCLPYSHFGKMKFLHHLGQNFADLEESWRLEGSHAPNSWTVETGFERVPSNPRHSGGADQIERELRLDCPRIERHG